MGGINDWRYGPPHESRQMNHALRRVGGQLNANADYRIGIGEFAAGISRDQRDWADMKTRPIERALSDILRKRISGDPSALMASAQGTVNDSFDKAGAGATRSAARRGVEVDPTQDKGFGLDRTKAAVQAGNLAVQTDRDNALQDAARFYGNGAGLPGMASQEYLTGAGSIADQRDYRTGMDYGDVMGKIDAQDQVGRGFMNMADGGEVGGVGHMGNRMGSRMGGHMMEGESERVELETGDFIVPEHAMQFYGPEFWDKLVADNGGDISSAEAGEGESAATESSEGGYADGGGVGFGDGYERGYAGGIGPIIGGLKQGLTAGLLDARATEEHDARTATNQEDRQYLREDRAYRDTQRNKAETKALFDRELQGATAEFMRNDGTDLTPIINVQRKYMGSDGTVNVVPNGDGKTYKMTTLRADGSAYSPPRDVDLHEVRKIGVGMIKVMSDPKAMPDIWKNDENWTSYGGGLGLLERNSGRTRPGLDPETLLSVRGRQSAGPKAVRYPQRGMILDAEDMLKNDPDLANLGEADRKALSINVASRAQDLLTEQPGIDASEAIAQALDEERANVAPGEKRDLFGIDLLARDKPPTYQDRRRAAPVATTPAEQALRAKTGAAARNTAPAAANEPTAVNPKTGERIVYRNGQWQPLK